MKQLLKKLRILSAFLVLTGCGGIAGQSTNHSYFPKTIHVDTTTPSGSYQGGTLYENPLLPGHYHGFLIDSSSGDSIPIETSP